MEKRRISSCHIEHERLVSFLDDVAVLLGCIQTLNGELPDSTRPDVIRLNTNKQFFFLGDAKNTESPNSPNTQHRLQNYLVWLSSFIEGGENRKAVFAICSNKGEDSGLWITIIDRLLFTAKLRAERHGVEVFDPITYIIWFETTPLEILQ
jgi:hypothetical protein